jgi:hypothetical protein
MHIIDVTAENLSKETLFCSKDIKSPGFQAKSVWFEQRIKEGLRLKILKNNLDKPIAFIEYIPAEFAWRPVKANNFFFIHCMFVYSNKDKQSGNGTLMLNLCKEDALQQSIDGICTMTSNGPWIPNNSLFKRNGFSKVDERGRFELMSLKLTPEAGDPLLIDWTKQQSKYQGWNLIYSDQCPWNEKSAHALKVTASSYGVELKITKLNNAKEAQQAPSGFAVFSLLKDGKLLEDHYLSETRFKSILEKELQSIKKRT